MKELFVIFIILIEINIYGQDTIEIKYFKNRDDTSAITSFNSKVKPQKGYYVTVKWNHHLWKLLKINKKNELNSNENLQVVNKKARYCRIAIKNVDGSIKYDLRRIKDNVLIKTWQYNKDLPIGYWIDYNDKGIALKIVNYDYDSLYQNIEYTDILHYDIITKKLKDTINDDFQRPIFKGDSIDFSEYIAQNVIFPKEAIEGGLNGKVIIQCVIEENGCLANLTIYQAVHKLLNLESLRVVKAAPCWKPARLNGIPIKVAIKISIIYQII